MENEGQQYPEKDRETLAAHMGFNSTSASGSLSQSFNHSFPQFLGSFYNSGS
jgi:hypothetical protein